MKEFICINCPMGCHLKVDDSDLNNIKVSGNTCKRGETYGINEILHPKRMVTSIVRVKDSDLILSVKTREAIPKELIFEALNVLKDVEVKRPIKIGDVVVGNILNTGVDVIATKNIN